MVHITLNDQLVAHADGSPLAFETEREAHAYAISDKRLHPARAKAAKERRPLPTIAIVPEGWTPPKTSKG